MTQQFDITAAGLSHLMVNIDNLIIIRGAGRVKNNLGKAISAGNVAIIALQLVLLLFCEFSCCVADIPFYLFLFPKRGNIHKRAVEHLVSVLFPKEKYLHVHPQHFAVQPQ